MQQLEETLNVSVCGQFLVLLAAMCIAAFSVVTVQCSRSLSFIITNNSIVKCEAVWYGRFVPTNCLQPKGRTFQYYLRGRPWQLHIAINKTEISVFNCTRNKLRSIKLVSFYIFKLGKFIDIRKSSSGYKYKIYRSIIYNIITIWIKVWISHFDNKHLPLSTKV